MNKNETCVVRVHTDFPEILNMESNEFIAEKDIPAKICLKFEYDKDDFKEYNLFVLKNGEPWQKILILVKFL